MITEQRVLNDMRRNERQQVEFKRGFIKTGDLAEQIMAFANAEGGTIYLGIADQPTPHPSGRLQQVTKAHYDNVHRAARDLLVPPVVGVTAHQVEVQGELILAIVVPRRGAYIHKPGVLPAIWCLCRHGHARSGQARGGGTGNSPGPGT